MKKFLALTLAAVMVLGLLSGVSFAEEAAYHEAPELAEQVAAGTLPAVEDRLPIASDVFVETNSSTGEELAVGTYGGTITIPTTGVGNWGISRLNYQTLCMYDVDGTRYMNVIKSYDVNEDYTVYTWHLREGLKWSDGTPFTTDDITYWYYMIHRSNYSGNVNWNGLYTFAEDGVTKEYATLEKIDDYTCTWTFAKSQYEDDFFTGDFKYAWVPSKTFIEYGLVPASYYFENPYWENQGLSDEQVLANAMAIGIEQNTVKDLGSQLVYRSWNYYQLPSLSAWILTDQTGYNTKDDDLIILKRNPYFFKVDAEGNQLPYIDEIRFQKYSDNEQMQLAFISGDIDYYQPSDISDIPVVLEKMGDTVALATQSSTNWGALQYSFNYTVDDANYHALFNNADFRQAMSIAIDRQYCADILQNGFVEPMNAAPQDPNFGYSEEWTSHWAQYDAEGAKALLEGTGLLVMGADGFYDFADGTDLIVEFITDTDTTNFKDKAFSVVQQYWTAIGIKTVLKSTDMKGDLIDANTFYAVFSASGDNQGGIGLISRPKTYLPSYNSANWTTNWYMYFDDPETNAGTCYEPADERIKTIAELGLKWMSTHGKEERDAIELEIYRLTIEGGWIGAVYEEAPSYYLYNSKIQNWFDNINEDKYYYIGLCHPWCWFLAE